MSTIDEARAMLDEIDQLIDQDARRKTLILYAKAMRDAIAKGDPDRIQRGLDIVRPVLNATRHLDLIG